MAMTKPGKEAKAQRLQAFDGVVTAYESQLLRYAARILSNYNAAQDVIQDTFIRLLRHWHDDLEPSPQLSSWLYRVAHNCAVDYLRKESRRKLLHLKHSKEGADFVAPNRGSAFRISEEAAEAVDALSVLGLRERQLVVLKVYEEKSYKEISEIADLTVSNVGYILHHAMKKMAAELKRRETI